LVLVYTITFLMIMGELLEQWSRRNFLLKNNELNLIWYFFLLVVPH
jgi:hypothetical protein